MTPAAQDLGSAVRALVDEWARAGVTDAVVAPGSRSTPLALALAGDARVRVHVLLDERSAAGFALGLGHATGRPAVVCCTSGTAGAHFHGTVLEAHHGRIPIIVCTADRPPELQDVGAGQTVDQQRLFGDAVRWFHDPGVPIDGPGAVSTWRHLGARSVAHAVGPVAGPVHLNLPFREPLLREGTAPAGTETSARPGDAPWVASMVGPPTATDAQVDALVDAVRVTTRGVVAAGWGAGLSPAVADRFLDATGWPLLADPLSNLRAPLASDPVVVSTYDAVLRGEAAASVLTPDLRVRVGAPLTSAAARRVLDVASACWLVDPDDAWLDPARASTVRLRCDADDLLTRAADRLGRSGARSDWTRRWAEVDRIARDAIDTHCDADDVLFEGRIARDVVASVPEGGSLFVASSMPVTWSPTRASASGSRRWRNTSGARARRSRTSSSPRKPRPTPPTRRRRAEGWRSVSPGLSSRSYDEPRGRSASTWGLMAYSRAAAPAPPHQAGKPYVRTTTTHSLSRPENP